MIPKNFFQYPSGRALWLLFSLALALDSQSLVLASEGVCAKVRLAISQDAVMTRAAFRATLELFNVDSTSRLTRIGVQPLIQDSGGSYANDRFSESRPQLTGLNAVDGTGTLSPGTSGSAAWTFVPSEEAAPTGPVVYRFGGVLTYSNEVGFITIPLEPVAITVLPDAAIYLKYFHQRDVLSDDSFTEVVEPAQPFYLAVQVENRGAGIAHNLRLSTPQPTIVDNEKGVPINFQVVEASVDGRAVSPSLGADFGELAPGGRSLALWTLTSTLQGLFSEYQATMQYLNGLGGRQFSSFKDVEIHELIHLVQAPGAVDDGKPDFLVNDFPDPPLDLPDTLYLSDGTTNPVQVVTSGSVSGALSVGNLSVQLTASLPGGWAYLRVPDPGTSQFRLHRVVRSDGVEVYFGTNVWTTDRTYVGMGRPAVYEHILHLLDYNSPGVYTLHYALPPAADTHAPTSSLAALPANSYPNFSVNWGGADNADGSGLAYFDVYVSTDGGQFLPWFQRTAARSAVYPGLLGSQYAFYSVATDAAGNREASPGTPQATTLVSKTNSAPAFAVLGLQTVDEGQTLLLDLPASDPDGDLLSFTLFGAVPTGLNLNPTSGRITWATGEANGPSTNTITVRVEDNGEPRLSATNTVTIIVREVNAAPLLTELPEQRVKEGQTLSIPLAASDFDIPAQKLSYQLGSNAPAGTAVTNGVFSWRPTELQGPNTNLISVIVSDDGTPSLSATRSFSVVVMDSLPDFTLSLGSTNLFVGETSSVPIRVVSGLDLTNLSFSLDAIGSRLTGVRIVPSLANVDTALTTITSNRWTATLTARAGQNLQGDQTIARLSFTTDPDPHSTIVPLSLGSVAGTLGNGSRLSRASATGGRVIIVGQEPVLEPHRAPQPIITLYGHPGASYAVECKTNLSSSTAWTRLFTLQLIGRSMVTPALDISAPLIVYRGVEVTGAGPWLAVQSVRDPIYTFLLQGRSGSQYFIQTSTNLMDHPWEDIFIFNLTNSSKAFDWTNQGEPKRFFRAVEW